MQWLVVFILLMVLGCRVSSLAQSSGLSLAQIKAAAVSCFLATFPIVKHQDEARYNGDYRTKRVILEIYDALAGTKTQKMTMCGILSPHEHRRTSM